jgi:hypothetical protein
VAAGVFDVVELDSAAEAAPGEVLLDAPIAQ